MNALPHLFAAASAVMAVTASAAEPRTVLLVDDHEILYRSGTRRMLHQPVRHPENPLIVGPTIKNQVAYSSVHRDAQTGRYKMWYQITGGGCSVAYAESTDGIAWAKPVLDLLTIKAIADRNLVLTSSEHYGASVVVGPAGGDPARRYKMAYWSIPAPGPDTAGSKDPRGANGGMYVAFSPDGIHWKKESGPVLHGTYGRSTEPPFAADPRPLGWLNSVSDVIDASFDPQRGKYVVYAKGWIDAPDGRTYWKRSIVRSESVDFLHWSPPQPAMTPDEHDGQRPAAYPGTRQGVQLHGAPVFVRHGVYLALLQVADFETHGQQPIELAVSRDGIAWSRPFRDQPFLPVGAADQFDSARIWSNATPVVLDDEIRFYFGGAENPWQFGKREYPWGSKKRLPKTGIGLATLPLDRFAGVRPIEKIGQITLRPRSLSGVKTLSVNADATNGAVRVELLDERGYRLRGFTKTDAVPIAGDGLRHRVSWKNADLASVPPGDVTIRLHLENAEVFALTLE